MECTIFFVQDGLLNGVVGEYATTCGFGEQLKDGWYYLPDGEADGIGPFLDEQTAQDAADHHRPE